MVANAQWRRLWPGMLRATLLVGVFAGVTWSGGRVLGVGGEVALLVLVLLWPLLRNRVQHMELAAARALRGPAWRETGGREEEEEEEEAEAEGAEARPVRTLGYNLFMRPSLWFVRNNDSDHKNERLAAFTARHLEHFDIICLQEMFGLLR